MSNFFRNELQNLKNIDLYRKLRLVEGGQGSCVSMNGKKVILLCSNNYLGLANHPSVKKAANKAIKEFGCGSGASRLISGTMTLHSELEKKNSTFQKHEFCFNF